MILMLIPKQILQGVPTGFFVSNGG